MRRHRLAGPRLPAGRQATAACWSAPAIPRRPSTSRRMAGLIPAGVICEIMNDDGTMARLPELVAFAQLHGLKIGTIADLIAYRRRTERYVERDAWTRRSTASTAAPFRLMLYRNTDRGGRARRPGPWPDRGQASRRWCGCTRLISPPTCWAMSEADGRTMCLAALKTISDSGGPGRCGVPARSQPDLAVGLATSGWRGRAVQDRRRPIGRLKAYGVGRADPAGSRACAT